MFSGFFPDCSGTIYTVSLQPVAAEEPTDNTISAYKDIKVNNEVYRISASVILNYDWKMAYKNKLRECINSYYEFELYDVDKDNIPELFISTGHSHIDRCETYIFSNNEAVDVSCYSPYGMILVNSDKHYILSKNMSMGFGGETVWQKDGDNVDEVFSASDNEGAVGENSESVYYYINGENVSKETYTQETERYDSIEWIGVGTKYKLTEANINTVIDNWNE